MRNHSRRSTSRGNRLPLATRSSRSSHMSFVQNPFAQPESHQDRSHARNGRRLDNARRERAVVGRLRSCGEGHAKRGVSVMRRSPCRIGRSAESGASSRRLCWVSEGCARRRNAIVERSPSKVWKRLQQTLRLKALDTDRLRRAAGDPELPQTATGWWFNDYSFHIEESRNGDTNGAQTSAYYIFVRPELIYSNRRISSPSFTNADAMDADIGGYGVTKSPNGVTPAAVQTALGATETGKVLMNKEEGPVPVIELFEAKTTRRDSQPRIARSENLYPPKREVLNASGGRRNTSRQRPPAAKPVAALGGQSPASEMVEGGRRSSRHGVRPAASCYVTPVDVVGGARAWPKQAVKCTRLARTSTQPVDER
ncbi:hypothetical protein R3P38DRAFT_2787462 [Favolaschia claudopus]|uniref:Uncharacterized protein n=1 Tax=Favolaschia claudopus TaxID=2862362 RepID=A0AAW0ANQ3_9AGAR